MLHADHKNEAVCLYNIHVVYMTEVKLKESMLAAVRLN